MEWLRTDALVDPEILPPILSERSLDDVSAERSNCFSLQSFGGGVATRAYEYFGVHREGNELVFRVWAPHAQYVSVCGDFTNCQTDRLPMTRRSGGDGSIGVWELHLSADTVRAGDRYKYFIRNGCREL